MSPERIRQVEGIVDAVLPLKGQAREVRLQQVCGGDAELRREVESFLATASRVPPQPVSPFEPGSTILHYRVIEKIGAGGMGEVFKAEDLKLGRVVALKAIHTAERCDKVARMRLLQEARSASALNHPNIITIHAIEQAGSEDAPLDFLVMEYLEGENLSARIRRAPLDLESLCELSVQVADALAAAHGVSLIHRDVKPSNIFITSSGSAKVLDFGLAEVSLLDLRSATEETATIQEPLTRPGMVIGTVAYMSPEQTRGEPLDARSDVFSLGCVLYEAATGKPPFSGASLRAIGEMDPAAPSTVRPGLPPEFDLIVEKALAKNRERRYRSGSELAQALRQMRGVTSTSVSPGIEAEPDAFVGRKPELRRLEELMRLAAQGSGRIVFVTGEPGIGKTSLASECLRRAQSVSSMALVARGACVEQYGTGEAYLPFLDALSSLLRGPGRERVLAVLRTYAPTWCLQLPAAFMSGGDLERVQRETIGATKERMLRELGDFLGALTASTPLILLLEDLHWADPSSADLIRHLGHRVAGQRLLLVGTFRPEDLQLGKHPLWNYVREMQAHGLSEELALETLDSALIGAYLDSRFAPNDFPPELAVLIQRQTEGLPLFVASLVQFLAERGDITLQNDTWGLGRPLADTDLEVPKSVRSMIHKKIELLEELDRRALEYASIEGEEFTSTVVAALLEIDDVAVEEQFDRLDKVHRLIHTLGEEELPDGSLSMRYRFAHALYQNTLYERLVLKRRIRLHRRAGEELRARYAHQAPRIAAQLATHFERGRDYGRAVEYLLELGDNARKLYDNGLALNHYTHALGLADKLPGEERAARQLTLYERCGAAYLGIGRPAEAEEKFTAMLEQAKAMSDPTAECRALNALANTLNYSHRVTEMGARAVQALNIAGEIGNQALSSESMTYLAMSHMVSGELVKGQTLFDQAIPLARSAYCERGLLPALTYRGLTHFFLTEYEQAEALELEASSLASKVRDGFHLATSLFYLGLSQANQGRLSEALATLNQALEMARRNGNQVALSRVPNGMGWVYRELNDLKRGIEHDRMCVEIARRNRTAEAEANALINLVHDYTRAGEPGLALAALRDVEPLIDRDPWNRWRFFEIRMQAGAAEYWLSQKNLDSAHKHAALLLTNASRYGVPKYVAVARSLQGEIALATGECETAASELKAALEAIGNHPTPLIAWRIYASLARAQGMLGEHDAMRDAFARSASIVRRLASQLTDETTRATFLNAPAIREVFEGATHARGPQTSQI